MNFPRNTSHFFKAKTIRSFCQNKFSCNFFNSNLNKFSTKNFVSFSNLFFLSTIQKMILTSRSLGISTSAALVGKCLQSGKAELETSLVNLENYSKGVFEMSELINLLKSIIVFLFFHKWFYLKE